MTRSRGAAEQANTALANGDISQEQYDALQREIVETENELKNLETQANESATALQKISATGEDFERLRDVAIDLGESYKYIAPLAQSMGLSIQDVTTALSAMSMAGIKGSQAGTISNLNIRSGPAMNYARTGRYTGIGVFTITAESDGEGASKWGKLKSGAGWISLDFVTRI